MTPTAIASSYKDTWTLVEFRWGDKTAPHYLRLTDRASPYVDGLSILWTPEPALDVSEIERGITLDERPVTIRLPIDLAFVDRLSNGEPHAPVQVKIREVFDDGVTVTGTYLFVGDVFRTIRNIDGHMALAAIECLGEKNQWNVPMGIIMDAYCANTLFQPGCFLDKTPFVQSRVIDTILPSGRVVHFTSAVTPTTGQGSVPIKVNEYWARGYAEYDGLRIMIRDARTVPSGEATPTMPAGNWWIMAEEVPVDWLGKTVTIVPGCNKLPKRCDEWQNTGHFAGSGRGMPAFHPNLETS